MLEGLTAGESLAEAVARRPDDSVLAEPVRLEPDAVAEVCEFGGGAGPHAIEGALHALDEELTRTNGSFAHRKRRWGDAAGELDRQVRALLGCA